MWGNRRRFPRPAYLAVLALVLIVGGCWTIESAATLASGPTNGYSYSGQGGSAPAGGQAQAPMVGPLPQPPPKTPTWTGTLRVTSQGFNMAYQPPTVDTFGGFATVAYNASDGTLMIENQGPAAIWTAERNPTYDECVALVNTQPLSHAEMNGTPYRQGQGLCVITAGKTAMAFVRGISAPSDPNAVQMSALRWPLTPN